MTPSYLLLSFKQSFDDCGTTIRHYRIPLEAFSDILERRYRAQTHWKHPRHSSQRSCSFDRWSQKQQQSVNLTQTFLINHGSAVFLQVLEEYIRWRKDLRTSPFGSAYVSDMFRYLPLVISPLLTMEGAHAHATITPAPVATAAPGSITSNCVYDYLCHGSSSGTTIITTCLTGCIPYN